MNPILLYLIIYVVKVIEVSMATMRIVLITKEERLKGAFIGFFEVIIWVMLAATVLTNIFEDPFKVVVYAFGFATGNFVGSKLESFFGIGTTSIEAIVHKKDGKALSLQLRDKGFAVTAVEAYGMTDKREILYLHVPRKKAKLVVKTIRELQDDCVITVHEIKPIYGGYNMIRK